MIRFTLRQLQFAISVAEAGSVAAAAEVLGVAQPSISAALMKLEGQIGLQLFIRHHAQGMTPTPEGQRFLNEARHLLRQARDLQRQAGEAKGPVAGELALGCFTTIAPVFLPEMMKRFRALHPDASLKISEGAQEVLIEGLRGGRHDAALLYEVGLPDDIATTHLVSLAPQVLLPASHALAKRSRVSLVALKDEPFILLDIAPSRSYFTGLLNSLGLPAEPAYSSPSLELVRGLVGQGLGYSILVTRPHGDHSYDGQPLAIRPIAEKLAMGEIGLASLKQVRPSRIVTAFLAFAKEFFRRRAA